MKNIAKRIFNGFCYGLGISIGLAVILIAIYAYETITDNNMPDRIYIQKPEGVTIANIEKVTSEMKLKVRGSISNNSDQDIHGLDLEAIVKIGDAQIGICTESVNGLEKNSARNFEIECNEISSIGLPKGIDYTITVNTGTGTILK